MTFSELQSFLHKTILDCIVITNNFNDFLLTGKSETDFLAFFNVVAGSYTYTLNSDNTQLSFNSVNYNISIKTHRAEYRIEGKKEVPYISFYSSNEAKQIYLPRTYSVSTANIFDIRGQERTANIIKKNPSGFFILDGVAWDLTSKSFEEIRAELERITNRAFFFNAKVDATVNLTGLTPHQVLLGASDGSISQTDKIVIKNNNLGIGTTNPVYSFDLLDDSQDANIRIKSEAGNAFLRLAAHFGRVAGVNFQINNQNVFTNFADSEKWGIYSQLLNSNVLEISNEGLIKLPFITFGTTAYKLSLDENNSLIKSKIANTVTFTEELIGDITSLVSTGDFLTKKEVYIIDFENNLFDFGSEYLIDELDSIIFTALSQNRLSINETNINQLFLNSSFWIDRNIELNIRKYHSESDELNVFEIEFANTDSIAVTEIDANNFNLSFSNLTENFEVGSSYYIKSSIDARLHEIENVGLEAINENTLRINNIANAGFTVVEDFQIFEENNVIGHNLSFSNLTKNFEVGSSYYIKSSIDARLHEIENVGLEAINENTLRINNIDNTDFQIFEDFQVFEEGIFQINNQYIPSVGNVQIENLRIEGQNLIEGELYYISDNQLDVLSIQDENQTYIHSSLIASSINELILGKDIINLYLLQGMKNVNENRPMSLYKKIKNIA